MRYAIGGQEEMKRKATLAKERARLKAQKEEQERNARPHAVASLSTLDIPAELATIFNKIDGKLTMYKYFIIIRHSINETWSS